MPRVMVVYGTRPEAIKLAPVIRALAVDPDLDTRVVVTGQHRLMLDQVNRLFEIEPDVDLALMAEGQSLTAMSARVLEEVGREIEASSPDAVLVQGDTSTAAMAAIAAHYAQVPVVHLEAGLRSRRLDAPFPEEANRQLIGRLASLHLAPTPSARENLLREAVDASRIITTGNTVIDALLHAAAIPAELDPALDAAVASGRRVILTTTHRRESWGGGVKSIAEAIAEVVLARPDVHVIAPLHGNPRVREAFAAGLGTEAPATGRVTVVDSLDYHQLVAVLSASTLVLTDSGGLQEEAPSLGKPVLVTRDTTERPEGVAAGVARIVGTDRADIVRGALELLDDPEAYRRVATAVNPYGDGAATSRVVAAIRSLFALGVAPGDFDPRSPRVNRTAAHATPSGIVSHQMNATGSSASASAP